MTNERIARLAEQLLDEAETARGRSDWSAVRSLAGDVLALDAVNAEAQALLSMAERHDPAPQPSDSATYIQRRRMTVLFCDLVGSTVMAEHMDPELMRDVLLVYQDACHQAVKRFDGHVAKYLGDGLMVFFGFPLAHEDDARRAVYAGLAIIEAMRTVAPSVEAEYGVLLETRVGIHTGLVVIAEMGSGPDVVGSTVNQTDRIQHKAVPGTVVISEDTASLVAGYFELESMGPVELPGISEPVELLTAVRPTGAEERLEAAQGLMTPFVGRDEERRLLSGIWERVRGTDPASGPVAASVLLRGEAGLGKSRLGSWLRDLSARTGGNPLWGTCSPYYGGRPFHPLSRMLELRMGFEPGTVPEDGLQRLEGLLELSGVEPAGAVPYLAPLIGVALDDRYDAPELEPLELRERTIATFVEWWRRLAAQEPLVVAIEDLHWAEPSTLELLQRVITAGPARGMMLVLTARPEFTAEWEEAEAVEVLDLDPLDHEGRVGLVRAMVGGAELPAATVDELAERSDGVPLFLEELVRHAGQAPELDAIPATLQELLLARLESAGAGDLRLAQVAATIGRRVDIGLTAAVMNLDESAVRHGLDNLLHAGLLEMRGIGEARRYAFRHALIRDTAYESQLLHEAERVHSDVADALIGRIGTPLAAEHATIALHLDRGGRGAEAVGFYYAAGESSQTSGAYLESVVALTRALELVDQIPEGEARDLSELGVRILLALGITFTQGYGADSAYVQYQRALELSDRLGDRPESLTVMLAIQAYSTIRGLRDEAGEVTERLNRRVVAAAPELAAQFDAEVMSVLGLHQYVLGEYASARESFEHALVRFDNRPADSVVFPGWTLPNDPVVAARAQLIPILWVQGEATGAWESGRRALARCDQLGYPSGPFSAAYVHGYLSLTRAMANEPLEAASEARAQLELGNRHGFAMWQGFGNMQSILAGATVQPSQELLAAATGIRQVFGGLGVSSFQPLYMTAEADLMCTLGDPAGALELFDQAIALAESTSELHYQAESYRHRAAAQCLLDPSRSAAIAADLGEAAEIAATQGATVFRLRALLDMGRLLSREQQPLDVRAELAECLAALPEPDAYPEASEAVTALAAAG